MAQLVKNPPARDLGSIPGLGRSPEEGKGYPLWYSGLENPMDYISQSDTTEQLSLSHIFMILHEVSGDSAFIYVCVQSPDYLEP